MIDKSRILGKVDELNTYLSELMQIMPERFEDYKKIEKRRSCERLIQLCIECTIDVCKLFVSGLRLGLPSEEIDLFHKLEEKKILSDKMVLKLKEMRGLRNILVHEYAQVDNELVFKNLKTRLQDFEDFKKEILSAMR